jgi:hypothetical protein
MLRQPPCKRALRNADLFGDFGLPHIQSLSQQEESLYRQPLAHQFGQSATFVHRPAEYAFPA